MILFDSVSKSFELKKNSGRKAIHNLSLHIPAGIIVGLIGPSGAGKTTFLKLICGLLKPDEGRVKVMGFRPVKERSRLSHEISVLFADHSILDAEKTVQENLELLRAAYGIECELSGSRTGELLQVFGLADYKRETVKNLSLGFRRRAELAAAFFIPARLLLLDEPCIGMDELAKESFQKAVLESRRAGKTLIISSHNMGEIDALSDRILLLNHGEAVYYGQKERLYRELAPVNRMEVSFADGLPDMQDLPFLRYELEDLRIRVNYNSNHITAAELLQTILQTSDIKEISMVKPTLEDIITETAQRRKSE